MSLRLQVRILCLPQAPGEDLVSLPQTPGEEFVSLPQAPGDDLVSLPQAPGEDLCLSLGLQVRICVSPSGFR